MILAAERQEAMKQVAHDQGRGTEADTASGVTDGDFERASSDMSDFVDTRTHGEDRWTEIRD